MTGMMVESEYSKKAGCVIRCGDWRELIVQLPNGCVDLAVTSPPYCLGKSYDVSRDIKDFEKEHQAIIPRVLEAIKPGGNICWQVGYHAKKSILAPLDYVVHSIFSQFPDVKLRNRIIWTFNSGTHGTRRLSGRHEIVLWYTKGDDYYFDVDPIRVPQKYPGKRHHKGDKRGQFSGNPLGKNPGDVWDIPNVKAASVEKTKHPCQFPIGLVQGLIMALSPPGGLVFDPYLGSGSAAAAAILEKRRFVGAEIDKEFLSLGCRTGSEGDRRKSTIPSATAHRYRHHQATSPSVHRTLELRGNIFQMTSLLRYKSVPVEQHGHRFYLFSAPAKILFKVLEINQRDSDKDEGYQRTLSKARVRSVSKFVDDKNVIAPAIVVSLKDARFDEGAGELTIPESSNSGWVIDGQHRPRGGQGSFHRHRSRCCCVPRPGYRKADLSVCHY